MECVSLLEDFLRAWGTADKGRFLAAFREPFLLVDLSGSCPGTGGKLTALPPPPRKTTTFEPAPARSGCRWVMLLARSPRNPDADRITLGRANENDLVIPHGSVSKSHAYFRKQGERFSVHDAGSSFGTTVNGKALSAAAGCPLKSGDTIVLAKVVSSEFFLPADFFEYLAIVKRTEHPKAR
jgi:hypothetical protein